MTPKGHVQTRADRALLQLHIRRQKNVYELPRQAWRRIPHRSPLKQRSKKVVQELRPENTTGFTAQDLRLAERTYSYLVVRPAPIRWLIGRIPSNGNPEMDRMVLDIAKEHGWAVVRLSVGEKRPQKFIGAMSTRDMHQRVLTRAADLLQDIPEYGLENIRLALREAEVSIAENVLDLG